MILRKWEDLPKEMQNDEVRRYYEVLEKKKTSLFFKRIFDIGVSAIMLLLFFPIFVILGIAIKIDSPGPVFYRQERVTQYGKRFRIFKFRTMVNNADRIGTHVTINEDTRITKVGKVIRKYRLDEVSQLIDVFRGTMTFVGTRPEANKYVEHYTPEMLATLLLPAGVTSMTSIVFKNEEKLLKNSTDVDATYINEILPVKMRYNLDSLKEFGLVNDIKIMIKTVVAVIR